MKIAIDITPLKKERFLWHRVRGTGLYIEGLTKALEKYFPENQYIFFTRGEPGLKDVDLIHYPYFEPFFLTLPLRKPAKCVVTIHDLIPLAFPENFPAGIKGKIKWEIQKFSLKSVKAIISDSESSKKDITRFTGIVEDKIHVVYLAPAEEFRRLETGSWEREIRKKYKLPDRFALYVGDVTWNKNLPRLIEALKQVEIPLVMVGKALVQEDFDKANPWNQDLIKVQAMTKNNPRTIRLGFVPSEDLVKIYNLAEVFLMPSIYEGFGLPILEAMACSCPVVTAKNSSLAEIAGEAAVFVDPYNVESMAEGIRQIYFADNEQRLKLKSKSLFQAQKFTWQKTAEKTIAVYQSVAS